MPRHQIIIVFHLFSLTASSQAASLCDKRDSSDNCSAFTPGNPGNRGSRMGWKEIQCDGCRGADFFYGHTIKRAIERLKVSPKCI